MRGNGQPFLCAGPHVRHIIYLHMSNSCNLEGGITVVAILHMRKIGLERLQDLPKASSVEPPFKHTWV